MRRITGYKLVRGQYPQNLEARVAAEIADGWQPLGGPIYLATDIEHWHQAMVRYEAPAEVVAP
jgi:hypothetical protein